MLVELDHCSSHVSTVVVCSRLERFSLFFFVRPKFGRLYFFDFDTIVEWIHSR